jgi:hypothetical protein
MIASPELFDRFIEHKAKEVSPKTIELTLGQ